MASIAIPPVFVIFTIIPEAFSPIIFYIVPFPVSPLPALHHKVTVHALQYDVDYDTFLYDGFYQAQYYQTGCPNSPLGDTVYSHFFVEVHRHSDDWITQTATAVDRANAIYERNRLAGSWTLWVPISTSTPPEEHSAAMASGLVGTYYYRINQFQELKLSGDAGNPKGFPPNSDIILADLPIGYRPVRDTIVNASSRQVGSLIGQHANVSVLTNGEIHYYSTSDPGYIVVISDSFYTV